MVELKKEFQNLIARITKLNIGPTSAELKPQTQSSEKPLGLLEQSERDTRQAENLSKQPTSPKGSKAVDGIRFLKSNVYFEDMRLNSISLEKEKKIRDYLASKQKNIDQNNDQNLVDELIVALADAYRFGDYLWLTAIIFPEQLNILQQISFNNMGMTSQDLQKFYENHFIRTGKDRNNYLYDQFIQWMMQYDLIIYEAEVQKYKSTHKTNDYILFLKQYNFM